MSCKVVRDDQVRPVAWRQIRASHSNELAVSEARSQSESREFERRMSEVRLAQQSELSQAKQSAFQEGLRQGREEAASAAKQAAEKLSQTLTELIDFKRKLRLDAEREVVKLSLAVARRILNRELAADPDALEGIVYSALSKLQARETWKIRVCAQAAGVTNACVENAGVAGTVQVIVDPKLHPGDLIIETASGELDASVNTQLQEIERGFSERLAIR